MKQDWNTRDNIILKTDSSKNTKYYCLLEFMNIYIFEWKYILTEGKKVFVINEKQKKYQSLQCLRKQIIAQHLQDT